MARPLYAMNTLKLVTPSATTSAMSAAKSGYGDVTARWKLKSTAERPPARPAHRASTSGRRSPGRWNA
ncbi:hypothetical protein [Micromonospora sp. HUAS LYJ1]|uniref:hypothetical protein n=1 Tax=Micromonospora sp. HUAS LYJ1 TaxID=3061626 RepID=UPI0026726DB8|nr:hypothetical protein [Micromonospora sp. HUAS LYJ1]WKU08812.1 hypothetical protein Q2K16_32500 [Micromonospora sp. HUAS LYJ1]